MAFTEAEKTDIRRFCGYPICGSEPTQMFGYRYFQWYGTLEYYMNNLSSTEEAIVRTKYLPILNQLEDAVPTASDNLDTDVAAVWTHNKNEVGDRYALFDSWRSRLCDFLGVPRGDYFSNKGVRIVV